MATLTGTRPQNTYQGLLKMLDSDILEASLQQVSDGFGNTSPLFLSTSTIAILGASGGRAVFNTALLDADRTFTFQNADGVIATLEDCINSITGVGGNIQLVGDTGAIGPKVFYGTDGTSTRGFYTVNTILNFWQEGSTVFSTRTINTWSAVGGATNISAVILPKGNGAFVLSVADGTNVGGNVRGDFAVDLQRTRSVNTQVASGANSFVATRNCIAGGTGAAAFGQGIANGNDSFAMAQGIAGGNNSVASGGDARGLGSFAANRINNIARGSYTAAFGEQADVGGYASLGLGLFPRSVLGAALVVGGGNANFMYSKKTTHIQLDVNNVSSGTPYTFTRNALIGDLVFDAVGGSRNCQFMTIEYAAISNDSGTRRIWTREVRLTLDGAGTTTNILDVQVIYEYKEAFWGASTLVESVTVVAPNNKLDITFTPDFSGTNVDIQAFVEFFGVLGTS